MASDRIIIRGAREHNLKNIDLEIPRDQLVVITGLSGSGKSSLAFDTIYAEGQRRYVESLSAYARQFLEQMEKPEVDSIEGLSPAISIEQKTTSKNPRPTVGPARKGEYKKPFFDLQRQGYSRVRVNGAVRELGEEIELDRKRKHTIEVVVDRLPGRGPPRAAAPRPPPRAARRLARDGAAPRGRRGARRGGGGDDDADALLRAARVRGLRRLAPRGLAPHVLVQQPVRRLPGLRRHRLAAPARPPAGATGTH